MCKVVVSVQEDLEVLGYSWKQSRGSPFGSLGFHVYVHGEGELK